MTTWQRYVLLQIPGGVLTAALLAGLHHWMGLPFWLAVSLFLLYVAKDFALYPFLRRAYETNTTTVIEQLVGIRGKATESLDPQGYVEVRGELWQASAAPGNQPIPPGARIRVQAARDMTLIVTRDEQNSDKDNSKDKHD